MASWTGRSRDLLTWAADLALGMSAFLISHGLDRNAADLKRTSLVEHLASKPSFSKGSSRSRRLGTECRQESIHAASALLMSIT